MADWVVEQVVMSQPGVSLTSEGFGFVGPGLMLSAEWSQVLGSCQVGRQLYVLLPRRPPSPPWVAVYPALLPKGIETLEALQQTIDSRIRQGGYRHTSSSAHYSAEQVLEQVLRGDEVPGALEVPIGAGPGGLYRKTLNVVAFGTGGALAGSFIGPIGSIAGATLGLILPLLFGSRRAKVGRRVLVLTPDACVVGLPAGPAAFAWSDIRAFSVGEQSLAGTSWPCLSIEGDKPIGRIDARWFDAPLPLIVAMAEAYRKRTRSN